MITPAALAAVASGNFDNFIAASTPGGIERQEAQGQADLVRAADRLPITISPRGTTLADVAREWGVVFGDPIDNLFIAAKLPEGWQIKATDHSMHSDVIDAQGRTRAGVFYKAAFYDRRASLHIACRYRVNDDYAEPTRTVTVVDGATNSAVHTAGSANYEDFDAADALEGLARAWLNAKYPDHRNPFAYWNN